MSTPDSSPEPMLTGIGPVRDTEIPTGLRIASTLCWLVGVLTIVFAVAVVAPTTVGTTGPTLSLSLGVLAGIGVCVAGYLVRRRSRVGALLVVLGWALPALLSLVTPGPARGGNFLLFVVMVCVLWNWKHLHPPQRA